MIAPYRILPKPPYISAPLTSCQGSILAFERKLDTLYSSRHPIVEVDNYGVRTIFKVGHKRQIGGPPNGHCTVVREGAIII
jgi:hypothetical protein